MYVNPNCRGGEGAEGCFPRSKYEYFTLILIISSVKGCTGLEGTRILNRRARSGESPRALHPDYL